MENLFYFFVITFSIIGWYILLKELSHYMLYRNIDLDKDIKCKIIVNNNEDNIEVFLRRIIYIQNKMGILKNIEIIDYSSKDETYRILEKIHEEYPNIKLRKIL